jgi:nitrate/TMAO reductase-like tetraheme cytochrome c subunit
MKPPSSSSLSSRTPLRHINNSSGVIDLTDSDTPPPTSKSGKKRTRAEALDELTHVFVQNRKEDRAFQEQMLEHLKRTGDELRKQREDTREFQRGILDILRSSQSSSK